MKKVLILLLLAAACKQPPKPRPVSTMPAPVAKDTIKTSLKKLAYDSKKDMVCGMPVTAGIEDTLHYKGKLYGFCARQCKEEFIKSPQTYLGRK